MTRRGRPSTLATLALLAFAGAVLLLSVSARTAARAFLGRRERVIIVGAGAAGLAAAAALSGYADVTVLEARDRLGGRVHTNHTLGAPIELGGECHAAAACPTVVILACLF